MTRASGGDGGDGGSNAIEAIGRTVGWPLQPDEASRLAKFLGLLQRWNGVYNLTAVREPAAMRSQHIADCLAVVAPLQRQAPMARRVLDVGSGGGLPGVVIAAALPQVEVVCVDAVAKKAGFLTQVAATLPLPNLRSVHARIEALDAGRFDVITSRAFASVGDFVALTRVHLAPRGLWMAMKATLTDAERAELPAWADLFHVEQLRIPGLDASRCLGWIRDRAPPA